jgi:hypothetical protein
MKHYNRSMDDIIHKEFSRRCPLPIDIITNHMGNQSMLSRFDLLGREQDDGQLV